MIPVPEHVRVTLPPQVAADAPLIRAAKVAVALQTYGCVHITEACLERWPELRRLDRRVLARETGGTISEHWVESPHVALVLTARP